MMGSDVKQLILEALQIGLEAAQEEAGHYHQNMAGYRLNRHDALDADVEKIKTAIASVNNLSFDNAK
jgi:hypothetical protein